MAFRYFIRSLIVLCLAAPLRADDFRDFRIPTHRVFGLSGFIAADARSTSENPLNAKHVSSYWSGNLALQQFWLMESDKYRTRITSTGSFSGATQSGDSRISTSDTSRSTGTARDRHVSEGLSASWSGWAYPWQIPLGVTASLYGGIHDDQMWESSTATDHYPASSFSSFRDNNRWSYRSSTYASVGVGWGRVRDATGVYDTYLAESRLRDLGVIRGELSPQTRRQLADLYYRRTDFKAQHERNTRYFWREVEKLLRADPAVNSTALDAYSLYRIAEPINGGSYFRERGYFIGPIVQASHNTIIYRDFDRYKTLSLNDTSAVWNTVTDTSSRHASWFDELMAGGSLQYHLPINPFWQLEFESTALFPVRPDDKKGMTFSNRLNAMYVIADRWRATGSLVHQRDYSKNHRNQDDSWTVHGAATLQYYVEDHMSVAGTFSFMQETRQYADNNGNGLSKDFRRDSYLSLSLVYHFAGIAGFNTSRYDPNAP
jgi:hypothetical protein